MHGAVTRIAPADNYDSRIHLHGVYAQSGVQSGTNWGALDGYTVQNGDHLYWRQYNSGANGGINLQAGSVNLSSSLSDTSGAPVADMTQQAKWVNREVDLSPGAGYTLTNLCQRHRWCSYGCWCKRGHQSWGCAFCHGSCDRAWGRGAGWSGRLGKTRH